MTSLALFHQRLLTLLLLPLLIFGGIPVEVDCCCDVRSSRSELDTDAVVAAAASEVSSCCSKNAAPSDEGAPAKCEDCSCRLQISRHNEQPLSIDKTEAPLAFVFTAESSRVELPWLLDEGCSGLRPKPEDRAHPPPIFLLFGNLRC